MKKIWTHPRVQAPGLLLAVLMGMGLFGFAGELKAQANNSVDAQGTERG
jgi:hypothetical protein